MHCVWCQQNLSSIIARIVIRNFLRLVATNYYTLICVLHEIVYLDSIIFVIAYVFKISLYSIDTQHKLSMQRSISFLVQTQNAGIALNPANVGIGEQQTRICATVSNYSTALFNSQVLEYNLFTSLDAKLWRTKKNLQISGGLVFNRQDPRVYSMLIEAARVGICIGVAKHFGRSRKQYISFGSTYAYKQIKSIPWLQNLEGKYFDFDLGILYGLTISKRTSLEVGMALQHQRPRQILDLPLFSDDLLIPINTRNLHFSVLHQFSKRINCRTNLIIHDRNVQNSVTRYQIMDFGAIANFTFGNLKAKRSLRTLQLGIYARQLSHYAPYLGFAKRAHNFGLCYKIPTLPNNYHWRWLSPISNLELSYNYLVPSKKKDKKSL
jgi:hypothetical protein